MKNKLVINFNSHRTYDDFLSPEFINHLREKKLLSFNNNKVAVYENSGYQVIIDHHACVHFHFPVPITSIDSCLALAKEEYISLTKLSVLLDKQSPINIIVPRNLSDLIIDNQENFLDLDTSYFTSLN